MKYICFVFGVDVVNFSCGFKIVVKFVIEMFFVHFTTFLVLLKISANDSVVK